jgi:predicted nuclease of restriction endonuclease-like (RecB) superfamily
MKVKKSETLDLKEYSEFLEQVKNRIRSSQLRASLAVNGELIQLYWWIGHTILNKQSKEGWGTKVIERLAKDLSSEFPGIAGFSSRNLKYMRKFAEAYPDFSFVQAAPAQIPWWHNVILLEKLEDWIKSNLYQRQGKALTNFQERLPLPQSHLAQEITKNPYNWDFLCLADGYREKELEDGLIAHIQKFLLELGAGFAFMGRQYHLEVDGDDYYIDLLFYHARLHCYVAIELKAEEFKPEHAGKMNFYLAALDATLKSEHDNPSIGMILCKKKSKVKVEYAFRNCTTPIGVATYETQIIQSLPKELKGSLPTIAEIEAELSKDLSSN